MRVQGPALLVRNDAVFSEADFQSISRVGDSVKRGQAGKTGMLLLSAASIMASLQQTGSCSTRLLCNVEEHCVGWKEGTIVARIMLQFSRLPECS